MYANIIAQLVKLTPIWESEKDDCTYLDYYTAFNCVTIIHNCDFSERAHVLDITRHVCRGDIFFSNSGATPQNNATKKRNCYCCHTVFTWLTDLSGNCIESYVGNYPLFQIYRGSTLLPLRHSMGRKHLKVLAAQLPTSPNLTFHFYV